MKLLDKFDVCARLGMKPAVLEELVRRDKFPEPITNQYRVAKWPEEQIAEYPNGFCRYSLTLSNGDSVLIDPALQKYVNEHHWCDGGGHVYRANGASPSFLADEIWELINGPIPAKHVIEFKRGNGDPTDYRGSNLKLVPPNRVSHYWTHRQSVICRFVGEQVWEKFGVATLRDKPGSAVKLSEFYETYASQCRGAGVKAKSLLAVARELRQFCLLGRYKGNCTYIANVAIGPGFVDGKPLILNDKGRLVESV